MTHSQYVHVYTHYLHVSFILCSIDDESKVLISILSFVMLWSLEISVQFLCMFNPTVTVCTKWGKD